MNAEIFIRTSADESGAKKTAKAVQGIATEIKALDYQFRQGKISADQQADALGKVATKANALNMTFKQSVTLNAQLYQVQQRSSVGFKSLAVTLDGMHNTMQQKATPSVLEFSRIVQDMPYGIQGVSNNITQLVTNFSVLRQSAGSTGAALKAMGGAMMGPMGVVLGVSLAVSLLPKLIDWLSATDDSTSKANTELEKMRDLLERISRLQFEIGETSEKQRRDKLEVDIYEAERTFNIAVRDARSKELKILREAYGPGVGAGSVTDIGKDTPEFQAVLEAKKALFEFDKSRDAEKKRAIKEQTDELKKQNAEYEKQVILTAGQEYGYAKGMSRNMMLGPSGTIGKFQFGGAYGRQFYGGGSGMPSVAGQGKIPMMGGAEYKPPKVVFGEWMSYSMDFQSAFMSGIGSISSSISSQIGGAFASVFGGAKTLLGNFVQMFMQALAEMAMRAAALFLFTSIFPSTGPFFGLGKPGKSTVGTDSGSIAVGLAQSRSRSNGLNVNVPEIAARIENDAIVLAYERGKLVRQNRIL